MDFFKPYFQKNYENKTPYVQKKVLYYQNIFIVTSLYILLTTCLYFPWFYHGLAGYAIMMLLLLSGYLLYAGKIIPSQLSLFFAGTQILLITVNHLTTFHFFSNLVMFVFITVIVCIEAWQIIVVYISAVGLLLYRLMLALECGAESPFCTLVAEDTIFMVISAFTLMLMSLYLEKMIRRGIQEKIELSTSADIDLLTKLYTRQKLHADTGILTDSAYELAIMDIDFFKTVNDTYGHNAGDHMLQELSALIRQHFQPPDFYVYRWGGEEFVVICHSEAASAFDLRLESFRKLVEKSFTGSKINLTISIGSYHVPESESFTQAFSNCDKALYHAKQTGRNKLTRGGVLS